MLLGKLIKNLPEKKKKLRIKGLSINSKNIANGFIFFAIRGHKSNGEKFINEAVSKGAKVVVCSKKCKYFNNKILVVKTSNIRHLLSEITSTFYKLKPKNIIAVTGTNGKTSVADLFYQILNLNNIPVASIGTLGIKLKGKIIKSNLTSPDIISLHKTLEKIKKKGIDNVIIEASSHGLHQKRINNLNVKAGIFTNFSQDHLDYHKSMGSYLKAKLLLFNSILSKNKTVISDKSLQEYYLLKNICKKRKLHFIDISSTQEKIKKNKNLKFNEFQIKNLSMAILAAKLCNLKEQKIFKSLKKIKNVNGRLELVKTLPGKRKIYVDFAHTPDALEKSLKVLSNENGKNISLVFGCGGDRDYEKRPLMGKIAQKYCKNFIVTDDNPRSENPNKIRKEIIGKIKSNNCFNVGNRTKAIKEAILKSEPNDIILVAGKGHEEEQIYRNKTIFISDKKIIKNIKLKKFFNNNQNFIQNKKILAEIKKDIDVKEFNGLSIDSRLVKKNDLFITIKGKKNDGNKFIPHALKKGAKYIISSRKNKKYDKKIIKVDNEINFLNKFARKKRDRTNSKILAITGSAGKTSLKNLLRELLQNFGDTLSSPKSYNNHFGVPLSLSQLKINHQYGIFEVGMSRSGEINKLSKLIRPHIAIITNIGEAHIENFKNLKGIAKAKGEIIENVEKNGTIILNRDDKYFRFLETKAKLKNLKILSFGLSKKSDVYLNSFYKRKDHNFLIIKVKNSHVRLKTKNINIYNILASLTLLKELNLDLKELNRFFKKIEPTEGRGKIHNISRYRKKFKLVDESYNANPLSVKTAIKNFNSINKEKFKKYLILGDMLELGKKSKILHEELSKVINNSDIDKVFVKGDKSLDTLKKIHKHKRGNVFQQDEDIDFTLSDIISNNDYLMIKGSNATGLNNFCKKLIRGY